MYGRWSNYMYVYCMLQEGCVTWHARVLAPPGSSSARPLPPGSARVYRGTGTATMTSTVHSVTTKSIVVGVTIIVTSLKVYI